MQNKSFFPANICMLIACLACLPACTGTSDERVDGGEFVVPDGGGQPFDPKTVMPVMKDWDCPADWVKKPAFVDENGKENVPEFMTQ